MRDVQVGFNTNVTYRGVTLHIQTEDSGLERPHVITHLYREGTILVTRRTSYDPAGEPAEVRARVRALMKSQHKQVILDLRNGVFDEAIRRLSGGAGPAAGDDEASAAASGPAASTPRAESGVARGAPAVPGSTAVPADGKAAAGAGAVPGQATSVAAGGRPGDPSPKPGPTEPDRVPPEGTTSMTADHPHPPRPMPLRPARQREREGFGKDLISDRSLDEVVLAYLAEELTKEEK